MIRSAIYNTLILRLTARWYAAVLRRLPDDARVLDVGIGTAGALLANAELVARKRLEVTGIDIDGDYIAHARGAVARSAIRERVQLRQESIDDHRGGPFDAVYFSASLMLLPEPERALRHACSLLAPGGRLYLTQTIQQRPAPWLERLKPALRWLTSIDFGHVTYADALREQIQSAGLTLDEFTTLADHGARASIIAVAKTADTGA